MPGLNSSPWCQRCVLGARSQYACSPLHTHSGRTSPHTDSQGVQEEVLRHPPRGRDPQRPAHMRGSRIIGREGAQDPPSKAMAPQNHAHMRMEGTEGGVRTTELARVLPPPPDPGTHTMDRHTWEVLGKQAQTPQGQAKAFQLPDPMGVSAIYGLGGVRSRPTHPCSYSPPVPIPLPHSSLLSAPPHLAPNLNPSLPLFPATLPSFSPSAPSEHLHVEFIVISKTGLAPSEYSAVFGLSFPKINNNNKKNPWRQAD